MTTTLESYERNGFTVDIEHDPDAGNPHEDASPGCALALFHRRYTLPNDPDVSPDDFGGWSEIADFLTRQGALYVMAVFMIDHSGLALSVAPVGGGNPFRDPWDSGQLGLAYITPEIWADCQGTDWDGSAEQLAQAQRMIEAEVETYGFWLNGETYAYTVTDEHGSERADCCGFLGWEAVTEAANETADGLEHTAATVRKTAADLVLALTDFDFRHSGVLGTALEVYAERMRETAAECEAALQPRARLHVRAAARLIDAGARLAKRLRKRLRREHAISLLPTPGGLRQMAQMFTDSAERADQAAAAYEELAGLTEQLAEDI